MKSSKLIAILIAMLCIYVNSYAQCPATPPLTDFSTTATESFCETDGTITVTSKTGGQSPFLHAIIAGPETRPGQSSNLFAALPAGTYTVEVRDFCGIVITDSIQVPGMHTPLTLSVVSEIVVCGNDGTICGIPGGGGDTTGGTVDYTYRLIRVDVAPPDTIVSMQADSCFTGLAEGDYDVQVFDECANFQTRGLILGRKQYAAKGADSGDFIYGCDSVGVVLSMSYANGLPAAEPPISWEIIASTMPGYVGTSGSWNGLNEYDTLYYDNIYRTTPQNTWVIQTTDACGVVKTSLYRSKGKGIYGTYVIRNCATSVTLVPSRGDLFDCPEGTITYEMTSAPAGVPLPPPSTIDTFSNLPYGNYCFRAIDCCMDTFNYCVNAKLNAMRVIVTERRNEACYAGTVNFSFTTLHPFGPPTTVVTSAPPGFQNPLPDTVSIKTVFDWKTTYKPPGMYCFEITDTCGQFIDTCITFTDTLIFDSTSVEVIPGCPNESQVCVTYTSNEDIRFELSGFPDQTGPAGTNMQVCFVNVPPGTKDLEAFQVTDNNKCPLLDVQVLVPDYESPIIDGAWGIECDGGTGLIIVAADKGVEPYTYELFAGPVTRPLQSSPYFPGLPVGTYSVRVFDICNNSSITDVDIEPATLLIRGYDGAGCIGDSISFYVDSIFGATYSWTGPNGFTNMTSMVEINNATVADAGVYTVNVVLEDEANNLCFNDTLSVNVQVINCNCSLQSFDATMVSCFNAANGTATANMSSGAGGPFTYQWSNGWTGQMIGSLAPGTYSVTITDSAGCSVIGDTSITQPPLLAISLETIDEGCFTASDGSITVITTGGTPGYTYQWSAAAGNQTTATATGLEAGMYALTVTDQAGCLMHAAVQVNQENCPSCAWCDEAAAGNLDICALLAADPAHPIGAEDCDEGGISNTVECINNGNPNDPADDCQIAITAGIDICTLINGDATHPFADQDCDEGGVSNYDECLNNGDPTDPIDDCQIALDADLNVCQLINYDLNHPLATLDCDTGGIDNITECLNGGDPSNPIDDCTVAVADGIDLCTFISDNPGNPLANTDCDEDGVTNATECTDATDPLDPCDFVATSITLPVTADQNDCENLCPDLTPITTIVPGNIAGASSVDVAVEITELNGIDTDGSTILVRMPSDPRLTFSWDPTLTYVALTPVNNANWNYLGSNGVIHTFQYVGNGIVIAGGSIEAFGFESVYDPQNTDGQTTVTSSIVPFGGGECNILNDTDSERLVYFE